MSHDVLILGAGPAGISAACFLAERGVRVAVVDPLGPGGRLVNVDVLRDDPSLPDGLMGWDLAVSLGEQALRVGVEVLFGQAERLAPRPAGGWTVSIDGTAHAARAVLVATGCRPEPLPGDEAGGLAGRGVAYCAVCDAGMFAGRSVVVTGGGDIAFAEAATLAALAAEVVVLCPSEAVAASATRVAAIEAQANVRVLVGATVLQVLLSDTDGTVRGVRYRDSADGDAHELAAHGVFGAHGELPNSAVLAGVAQLDERGFVRTDGGHGCLGALGVFAAGDVRRGAAPYVGAARGEGISAAAAILAHLGSWPDAGR